MTVSWLGKEGGESGESLIKTLSSPRTEDITSQCPGLGRREGRQDHIAQGNRPWEAVPKKNSSATHPGEGCQEEKSQK